MRAEYVHALEEARLDVVRLGTLVVEAMTTAIEAFDARNISQAENVIRNDREINEFARSITNRCVELIWKQQPVAGDLRLVAAMLQITRDLERAGDYAASISKDVIKLAPIPVNAAHADVDRIAAAAIDLLRDAIVAFSERDAGAAAEVIRRDDEVDRLYNRGLDAIQEAMQEDSGLVKAGAVLLFVVALLERLGDRAQNVAWHTRKMLDAA